MRTRECNHKDYDMKHLNNIKPSSISVGLSDQFYGYMPVGTSGNAFSKSFVKQDLSCEEFIKAILEGRAFTPACFNQNHRSKSNFQSAQIIVLSFRLPLKIEELLNNDLVANYAALVGHFPVKHLTEDQLVMGIGVMFILSEPVTGRREYDRLHQGLSSLFSGYLPYMSDSPSTEFFYSIPLSDELYWCNDLTILPIEYANDLSKTARVAALIDETYSNDHLEGTKYLSKPHAFKLKQDIERALKIGYIDEHGWSEKMACIFESHEDAFSNCCAQWNSDYQYFRCKKCGKSWDALETAVKLGLAVNDPNNPSYNWYIPMNFSQYTMADIGPSFPQDPDDQGNAIRFAMHSGNRVRFCGERDQWLIYNGQYWEWDETNEILEYALETAIELKQDALDVTGSNEVLYHRHARASMHPDRLQAMIDLARKDPSLWVTLAELDTDPNFISVENGTLDTTSGKLYRHDANDLITRCYSVVFEDKDFALFKKLGTTHLSRLPRTCSHSIKKRDR